jgi:Nucleoside-diphosphate-sugar epimerases
MMRDDVLILGLGFLGRALAQRLHAEGRTVHAIEPGHASPLEGVAIHQASMDDSQLLDQLLPGCGTVFHLASGTTPGSSSGDPVGEAENNILPSLRFLEIAQRHRPLRLVFASSGGALYGDPGVIPTPESYPLKPHSSHGAGKMAQEAFLHAFAHNTGSCVAILRPSNLYGPGQPLKSGFGIIRTLLEHASQGTPMPVWGDGETVRDFLYIDDMVEACRLLFRHPAVTGTFNVGSGQGHTINQVREATEKICGRSIAVQRHPARGYDVHQVILDNTNIEAALGWKPATLLEEGILRTWQWLLAHQ